MDPGAAVLDWAAVGLPDLGIADPAVVRRGFQGVVLGAALVEQHVGAVQLFREYQFCS